MPPHLLLLFVKEPLPGRVKTRLASGVGDEDAARIYRAMVRILLRQLSGLRECRLRICHAPDDADDAIRFWLLPEIHECGAIQLEKDQVDFRPQGPGDLGARLGRAFEEGFAEGYEKVAVIGSDCIEISSRWIHAAFAQINERRPAVIGPTPDGGYHVLATNRFLPGLFENIAWSTPRVFAETVERLEEARAPFYQLPPLPDIDTPADYEAALAGPLGRRLKKLVDAEP